MPNLSQPGPVSGPGCKSEFLLRHHHRGAAFQGVYQILGMEFQLLQPNLFELFIVGKVRLLNQLFQPLSVATVFGMQAVQLFAQRIVNLLGFLLRIQY